MLKDDYHGWLENKDKTARGCQMRKQSLAERR